MIRRNEIKNQQRDLPELTRDHNKVKRLFEIIPDVLNSHKDEFPVHDIGDVYKDVFESVKEINADHGCPVMYPDSEPLPYQIMQTYLTAGDVGFAIKRLMDEKHIDDWNTERTYRELISKSNRGILSQISMRINAIIFDAYKTLMNKASDYMHCTARRVLIEMGEGDEDYTTVANALIDEVCTNLDKVIQEESKKYMCIRTPIVRNGGLLYQSQSTPGEAIVDIISDSMSIYTAQGMNNDTAPSKDAKSAEELKAVTMTGMVLVNDLVQNAYNQIFYSILPVYGNNEEITQLMAAMDSLGYFTEYHEKLMSIVAYAFSILEELVDAKALHIDDYGFYNNEY